MNTVTKKINNLYKKNYIFIFALSTITFFSFIQVWLYATSTINIFFWGDLVASTDPTAKSYVWVGYFLIFLAMFGYLSIITGEIYLTKNRKIFIYFLFFGETLLFTYGIFTQLWFYSLLSIFYVFTSFWQYKNWTDEKDYTNKMTKEKTIYATAIMALFIALGLYLTISGLIPDASPYIDVIAAGIVGFSWYLILNKNKYGFFGFILTDIMYFIIFIMLKFWGVSVSYLFYMLFDGITLTYWWTRKKNPEKPKNKEIISRF